MASSPRSRCSRPVPASSCRPRRRIGTATRPCRSGWSRPEPARVNKALAGHYAKANVPPTRVRREVRVAKGARGPAGRRAGRLLDLRGRRRRGRHRHEQGQGLPGRHEAPQLRAVAPRPTARCSIGHLAASAPRRIPSRVIKGKKLPGHMGAERVTTRNLKVVRVDAETHTAAARRRGARRGRRLRGDSQGGRGEAEEAAAGRDEEEGQEIGATGY